MGDRKELRGKLLGSARKFKSEVIEFFGEQIEVRQPSLGTVLAQVEEKDKNKAIVRAIINYCYVPGTDEKVFEPEDEAAILNLPASEDIWRLNDAVSKLTGIDTKAAEGNS